MKRPDYVQISPADVERVGLVGAYVLALIRFRLKPDDEKFGRVRIDDELWWRASRAEIAAQLGLSADQVKRAVHGLEKRGELQILPGYDSDRTGFYRIPVDQPLCGNAQWPDQSLCEIAPPPSSQGAESPRPRGGNAQWPDQSLGEYAPPPTSQKAESPHPEAETPTQGAISPHPRGDFAPPPGAISPFAPISKEGGKKKVQETPLANARGEEAPPARWTVFDPDHPHDEPPRYCPDHPNDTDKPCGPCIPTRHRNDGWRKEQFEWFEHLPVLEAAQALGGKNLTADALATEAEVGHRDALSAMRYFEDHGVAVVTQKPAPGRYTAWSLTGDWHLDEP